MQLNQLDEMRQQAVERTTMIQQQRRQWHDKLIKKKEFQVGDWALLFDSKFKDYKAKFTTHWMGPYEIIEVFENGSIFQNLRAYDSVLRPTHIYTLLTNRNNVYTRLRFTEPAYKSIKIIHSFKYSDIS